MNDTTESQDIVEAKAPVPEAALRQGTAPSIMLDEAMFDRAKFVAKYMAEAQGFTPKHLVGKPQACFAVVVLSINWKLEPFMVARCTYETPGGSIGYEGKLIQAIIEESGRLVGPVKYKHYGDWSKVQNKYRIETSGKGHKYPVSDWKPEDEKGLGVTVSGQVRGEDEPRSLDFDLLDAFPRNSTLWATRPKQQICYTAVRAFGNLAVPSLVMGVPFDVDEMLDRAETARDITPRPTREDYAEPERSTAPVESFILADGDGEIVQEYNSAAEYTDALTAALRAEDADHMAIWEANEDSITALESNHREGCYEPLWKVFEALVNAGEEAGGEEDPDAEEPAGEEEEAEEPTGWQMPSIVIEQSEAGVIDWKKLTGDLVDAIKAAPTVEAVEAIMELHGSPAVDDMRKAGVKASANKVLREADQRRTELGPRQAAE